MGREKVIAWLCLKYSSAKLVAEWFAVPYEDAEAIMLRLENAGFVIPTTTEALYTISDKGYELFQKYQVEAYSGGLGEVRDTWFGDLLYPDREAVRRVVGPMSGN